VRRATRLRSVARQTKARHAELWAECESVAAAAANAAPPSDDSDEDSLWEDFPAVKRPCLATRWEDDEVEVAYDLDGGSDSGEEDDLFPVAFHAQLA
jgi:hypothetical protein